MIDIKPWMEAAVQKLRAAFGDRLLFVGLQGSYRRGEATEESDIDILMVLDTLSVQDLDTYRKVLRTLPEGEKAGGFTCGCRELYAWPRHELFQFARDTDGYYGQLGPLLPPVTRTNIEESVRISAANLYHVTAHARVVGSPATRTDALRPLYKDFFFLMQVIYYLRSGEYVRTKRELAERLSADELAMLCLGMDDALFARIEATRPDSLFDYLLRWCGEILLQDFAIA